MFRNKDFVEQVLGLGYQVAGRALTRTGAPPPLARSFAIKDLALGTVQVFEE